MATSSRHRSRSPPPHKESRRNDSTSQTNNTSSSRRRTSRSRSPDSRRRRDDGRGDDRRRDDGHDRRRGEGGGSGRDRSNDQVVKASRNGQSSGDGGWGAQRERSPGRPSLSLPSQSSLVGSTSKDHDGNDKPQVAIIEPNYAPSGALAAETNTFQGVVLKYNEPPEARKPVRSWRLYVFKGKEQVELFHVHRQSAYLLGRDRIVADIPIDHPSTSKQHAVLQYRQAIEKNEFGDSKTMTKPFVIDLDSANGTLVNDERIPASRYYELKSGDVLKFAFSTREYVLLAET